MTTALNFFWHFPFLGFQISHWCGEQLAPAGRGMFQLAKFYSAPFSYGLVKATAPSTPLSQEHGPAAAIPNAIGFRECDVCPEMVVVPAGEFLMGRPNEEVPPGAAPAFPSEGPQPRITLDRDFAVGRCQATQRTRLSRRFDNAGRTGREWKPVAEKLGRRERRTI